MSTIFLNGAIVTMGNVFRYKGVTFEFHEYLGPSMLKKNGDPSSRLTKKFCALVTEWRKLPKKKREKFRV